MTATGLTDGLSALSRRLMSLKLDVEDIASCVMSPVDAQARDIRFGELIIQAIQPEGGWAGDGSTKEYAEAMLVAMYGMQHKTHYDSTYAATPTQDSTMFFNALVVFLKLLRRSFDVGNAYGWAARGTKLALRYPRGMEQYNAAGKLLFMCLHRNTYGTPDGCSVEGQGRVIGLHARCQEDAGYRP